LVGPHLRSLARGWHLDPGRPSPPRSGSGYGDRAGSASTLQPGRAQPAVAAEGPVPLGDLPVEGAPAREGIIEHGAEGLPRRREVSSAASLCGAPISRSSPGKASPPGSLRCAPISRLCAKAGHPLRGSSGAHRFPGHPGESNSLPGPCAAHRFPGRPGAGTPFGVPVRRTDFPVAPRSSPARLPGGLPGLTYSVGDSRPVAHPRKRQKSHI
jgi:hypothetical protein